MRHLITVAMTAAACLGIAVPGAVAQTAKDLVGTWTLESDTSTTPDGRTIQPFGPNPQGIAIFDSAGHFAIVNSRSDLPKFASNNRMHGTAEENEAIVHGSIAFFGTYSVTDGVLSSTSKAELGRPGLEPIRSELSPQLRETSKRGPRFRHSAEEVNFTGSG